MIHVHRPNIVYNISHRYQIELDDLVLKVVCWGVRSMRKFQLSNVVSPNVEIEVGDQVVRSKVIKNAARNPNFDDPMLFFDVVRMFSIYFQLHYMNDE